MWRCWAKRLPSTASEVALHEIVEPDPNRASPRYSKAVKAGNVVHVSGQIATDADGNLVGGTDCEKQSEQCFRNIQRILSAAGAHMEDVVIIRAFLLDRVDYAGYAVAKAAFYPANPPAGTVVLVAGLLREGALVEIEVTAIIPE